MSDISNNSAVQVNANDYDPGTFQEPNFWQRIDNAFTGNSDTQRNTYNAYAAKLDRQYEIDMINDARRYEDSKYQRTVEDLKKAGLNPYLALSGGLGFGPSASVSAQSESRNVQSKKPQRDTSKTASSAGQFLKMAGLLILKSMFLG